VTFLVYEQTLRADALGLIAAKARSALIIEDELPEDGLAALEGDNHDVFLALAKRLTERSSADDQSLEEFVAGVRQIESQADGYLVDPDWVEETAVAGPGPGLPPVDSVNIWQSVFCGPTNGMSEPEQAPPIISAAKATTFADLARLVQRPRPRRRAVPGDQLALAEQ
jgi:hypothetical protein